tara:strand:+ start:2508 stop:3677 length:1170 start_codon:yes stop_codon:yes gene_type:complete
MNGMYLPNYKDGSIVNLMSSIGNALGAKSKYKPLKILKPSELKKSKNVVLMLIDGLGYEFLKKNGKGTVFNENLRGRMTSVFPSATSAAIPSLMTGFSPQEHAMTGWYMFMKELGVVGIPLRFVLRSGTNFSLGESVEIKKMFNIKPFADRIKFNPYLIQPKEILNTEFTIAAGGKSKRSGYIDMDGYFRAIKKVIKSGKGRKYVFAYYPVHDSLCHEYGTNSRKVLTHFKKLSKKMKSFLDSMEGSDTTFIISADHGLIDVPISKNIVITEHPKLMETLTAPVCGEGRLGYCYVKPSKVKEFERYVKTKLKHACYLYKSSDLLKKGYFGLFKPDKRFIDRIGDSVIVMKENYGLKDYLINSPRRRMNIGRHGGVSAEEMHVPLIVVES